jgi:aminopeptidase N
MEYAMCTLVLGEGTLDGLVNSLISHEMAHSWFQHALASNESKHPWMDEGGASFLEDLGVNEIAETKTKNPFSGAYKSYLDLANSGLEEPLSTHGDRFSYNKIYSTCSYYKGELFWTQLIYLIGEENTMKTLKRYYEDFKFKHPTPNDLKRTAERVSGANLDWYLNEWTQTTNKIDYGIKEVNENNDSTTVTLERIGRIPMPMDILVDYTDGSQESFYIPLRMMSFEKENPNQNLKRSTLADWAWAFPTYNLSINKPKNSIKKITIDPSGLMADVKKENNTIIFK